MTDWMLKQHSIRFVFICDKIINNIIKFMMGGDNTMDKLSLLQLELDAIIKSSNDNIVIANGDGIVLRSSPNCEDIYGTNIDQIVGRSVYELEKSNIFKPSVTAKVLKSKSEIQVMQETPNGKIVMATGIPVFNKKKEIIRVISFSHDLTEIHQLKDDYKNLQLKMKQFETEIEQLRVETTNIDGIIAKSKNTKDIIALINRVARSDATIVLLGESGVGKSMFAKAIHNQSKRNKKAFIEINAGAIPDSIFESELFGYERGAFTGARAEGKIGLIELANRGTLFFDEIAETPLDQQVKLLKVLEEKKITRVGGSKAINVDFRLIVATNRDLKEEIKRGTFREDLFYRLNVVPITIPPLRERIEDIYHLSIHFLEKYNKKYQTAKTFHPEAIKAMQNYKWPGNVRELENLIERLIITTKNSIIKANSLPFYSDNIASTFSMSEDLSTLEEDSFSLQEAVENVEKYWLKRAKQKYKTTYEIAKALNISQPTVVRKLKKYEI